MTRRELFRKIILTPLAAAFGVNIRPYYPFSMWTGDGQDIGPSLYGIPYHQSDGAVGSWCGFSRAEPKTIEALKELILTVKRNEKQNAS